MLDITLMPPKLTKQYGVLVISTIRTGSQNPPVTPGTGIGMLPLLHAHIGIDGFLVSLYCDFGVIGILPMVIGNKQLQHTSVIGFKNFPVHLPSSA